MKNSLSDASKQQIRQRIKTQRRLLDKKIQSYAANEVASRLFNMPLYKNSQSIAIYYAVNGELDPKTLLNQATDNKTFYLPIISKNNTLEFAKYNSQTHLQTNKFGIPEPVIHTQDQLISPNAIDLICVPLVAFDEDRNRLGMGAGYYDRALANHKPKSKPYCIGLAYEFQKIQALVPENWDIPMDCIITEQAIYSSPFINNGNTS